MPRNLPDNKCKHWPPFLPLINTAVQVVLLSLLRDSNIIRDVNAWFEEVYRIPINNYDFVQREKPFSDRSRKLLFAEKQNLHNVGT